jgi:hypothetical protein
LTSAITGNTFLKENLWKLAHVLNVMLIITGLIPKGVINSYTGNERNSIPRSFGVVACISQPFDKGCNLIRQVETDWLSHGNCVVIYSWAYFNCSRQVCTLYVLTYC